VRPADCCFGISVPVFLNVSIVLPARKEKRMYDIAVVGGGASGLAAALAAAETAEKAGKRLKIAVLEKNPRVGKKLLLTGNGRCNLTNRNASPERYYGDTDAASGILRRFPPEKIISLFQSHGLLCRTLDEGRVYPYSLQASSVLNVLRLSLEAAGVETLCGFDVRSIENASGGFALVSEEKTVKAKRVIAACGGRACPQSGSDGDGYALLKPYRHTVARLSPALTQIRTDPKLVRPLKGVRCMAEATLMQGGHRIKTTRGEVQFTENSLSGICIFEFARFLGSYEPKTLEIMLDLASEYRVDELEKLIRARADACGDMAAFAALEGILCKPLAIEVMRKALQGAAVSAGSLTAQNVHTAAAAIKRYTFPAWGTAPWQNAQVTAGGVPLSEVDGNLQSRFRKGLYLCGELLNIDGECGGFNLHWAWASGITAGIAAAAGI
jgi:predicted Rossmann fold flavoprotein